MSDAIAVVPETPAAHESRDALASLTDTQRSKWLETGELPQPKEAKAETKAEPSTSTEAAPSDTPADGTTPQPSSEPDDKPKVAKPRHDINARLGQLAEKARLATERAEAAERKAAELEAGRAATSAPPRARSC